MAGHNKWSKVKHKKAATDAVKSKIFSKHSQLIALEAKKAGGNLEVPGLIAAIERAKKDSMPKDNIERAIAKGSGADAQNLEEIIFEGYGPAGVALLIEVVTDNNNRTAPEIRHIFSKAGFQLGEPGSAAWAFTKTHEGYVPNNPIDISEEETVKLTNLVEALMDQDDVQEVYTSADTKEE